MSIDFGVIAMIIGLVASIITLIQLFRGGGPLVNIQGGAAGVLRVGFAILLMGVILFLVFSLIKNTFAFFTTHDFTSPPSASFSVNTFDCATTSGKSGVRPNYEIDLLLNNDSDQNVWQYAVSISDKDPAGHVWASIPHGAKGTITRKGSLSIPVFVSKSVCGDIQPHDSLPFTAKVTFTLLDSGPAPTPTHVVPTATKGSAKAGATPPATATATATATSVSSESIATPAPTRAHAQQQVVVATFTVLAYYPA